jgi:hypothetical protein
MDRELDQDMAQDLPQDLVLDLAALNIVQTTKLHFQESLLCINVQKTLF